MLIGIVYFKHVYKDSYKKLETLFKASIKEKDYTATEVFDALDKVGIEINFLGSID